MKRTKTDFFLILLGFTLVIVSIVSLWTSLFAPATKSIDTAVISENISE